MAVAPKVAVINDGQIPLPSFMFPGMPLGFIVADTTGQNWQLTTSTATVNHTTVEKCIGNPQLRWLAYAGGSGLNQLTGDVTAGPGTGSQAATLANLPLAVLKARLNAIGGGPALLKFAADGTPSAAANGSDYIAGSANIDIVTAGSNLQNLAINPAGWTMNGDTDGDYELWGDILFPAGSGSTNYGVQVNADTGNNYVGVEFFGGTSTSSSNAPLGLGAAFLNIGTGTTNAGHILFHAFLTSKSGRIRQWECSALRYDATAPNYLLVQAKCIYTATATVLDGTTRLNATVAASILTGSTIRVRRLLNTT